MTGHTLVVGGTGMLAGVVLNRLARGDTATVIGRSRARFRRLAAAAAGRPGRMRPLMLDYRDDVRLKAALAGAQDDDGPIALVVCWAHATAPEAPYTVAGSARQQRSPCRFFHVLGSAMVDPSTPDPTRRARFKAMPSILYREVVLGFVPTAHGSRWLTDTEICTAVIDAIDRDRPHTVVGQVEPWSDRP